MSLTDAPSSLEVTKQIQKWIHWKKSKQIGQSEALKAKLSVPGCGLRPIQSYSMCALFREQPCQEYDRPQAACLSFSPQASPSVLCLSGTGEDGWHLQITGQRKEIKGHLLLTGNIYWTKREWELSPVTFPPGELQHSSITKKSEASCTLHMPVSETPANYQNLGMWNNLCQRGISFLQALCLKKESAILLACSASYRYALKCDSYSGLTPQVGWLRSFLKLLLSVLAGSASFLIHYSDEKDFIQMSCRFGNILGIFLTRMRLYLPLWNANSAWGFLWNTFQGVSSRF